MSDLEKFKALLEYFVAHLEYLRYRNMKYQKLRGRGYAQYILPLMPGFVKTGQGHTGDDIQNQISSWEQYSCANKTSGKIFINVQISFSRETTAANYLCWDGTRFNILAEWSPRKKVITDLVIEDKTPGKKKAFSPVVKSVSKLGLFDGKKPNAELDKFWQFYSQFA